MLYYKITAVPDKEIFDEKTAPDTLREQKRVLEEKISLETMERNERNSQYLFFTVALNRKKIWLGLISQQKPSENLIKDYLLSLGLVCREIFSEETTFQNIRTLLEKSCRNGYIEEDYAILEKIHMLDFRHHRPFFIEDLLPECSETDLAQKTDGWMSSSLKEELQRISRSRQTGRFPGHPVHYILETDSRETFRSLLSVLLEALLLQNRLQSRRYTTVDLEDLETNIYPDLVRSCKGGTIVLQCRTEEAESAFIHNSLEEMQTAMDLLQKYQHEVLTVLWLPRSGDKIKRNLLSRAGSCAFVTICEDPASGRQAEAYLQNLCQRSGLSPDESLYRQIRDTRKGFLPEELRRLFASWRNTRLRTVVFPQYASLESAQHLTLGSKPEGSAYEKLQNMIGLQSAKKTMEQALNFYKAQKLFKEKGLPDSRPAMHMVFTGNPGTAKTTVARLFAGIMKENQLLSEGRLFELGRSDLVGKYVGWTAQIVKEKFRKARGSVLFIDEAYSLLDGDSSLYGDEAINTIVQEMENCREDTVVIFAEYPREMEQFLSRNPGLRSRIAFHLSFEDYSPEELYRITRLLAEEQGLTLAADVREKLLLIFRDARKEPDFGNGRFARNLLEKAQMKQADRLVRENPDRLTRSDVQILTAEDFAAPDGLKCQKIEIGFSI